MLGASAVSASPLEIEHLLRVLRASAISALRMIPERVSSGDSLANEHGHCAHVFALKNRNAGFRSISSREDFITREWVSRSGRAAEIIRYAPLFCNGFLT